MIQIIRKIFGRDYIRGNLREMPKEKRQQAAQEIVKKVFGTAKTKTSLAVPRFQKISRGRRVVEERVFYEYDDDAKTITLRPAALEFFRENRVLLHKMVILEWANFLERINTLPRLIAKIQNYEARRGSLKKFRDLLAGYTEPARCFYCGCNIVDNAIHVDHFIPWSYVFENELWNLVLSCPECNSRKSDLLADRKFLDMLMERNTKNVIPELARSVRKLGLEETEGTKLSRRTWREELGNMYDNCIEYGFQIWNNPIKNGAG